jgi:hypothetical protein
MGLAKQEIKSWVKEELTGSPEVWEESHYTGIKVFACARESSTTMDCSATAFGYMQGEHTLEHISGFCKFPKVEARRSRYFDYTQAVWREGVVVNALEERWGSICSVN